MKEIKLTNSGKAALVDDEDFDKINKYKWRESKGYAVSGGSSNLWYMQYFIVPFSSITTVDHVNRNGLDNRKENLRVVTRSQNLANKKAKSDSIDYRGVYVDKRHGGVYALITVNRKTKNLGTYPSKEEAALAYNKAAKAAFGECAHQNEIPNFSPFLTTSSPLSRA
jgi:hypothetical protein